MADILSRPLLSPEHIALIDKGISANVASRNAALRPSVMRAVGASISQDGTEITVFVSRSHARQLLQDIAATGEVAVVFSEPVSHRTVQVKASKAELRAAEERDLPVLRRYGQSMEHELSLVGCDLPFVHTLLAFKLDELVAVQFSPDAAFDQTPGPKAGTALPGTATP